MTCEQCRDMEFVSMVEGQHPSAWPPWAPPDYAVACPSCQRDLWRRLGLKPSDDFEKIGEKLCWNGWGQPSPGYVE